MKTGDKVNTPDGVGTLTFVRDDKVGVDLSSGQKAEFAPKLVQEITK